MLVIETIFFSDELYTFDEKKLFEIIKKCKNEHDNLILFGHNEAITNFVNKFGNIFIENVPTSGLVWIKFDCLEWKLLKKGKTQNNTKCMFNNKTHETQQKHSFHHNPKHEATKS